MNLGVLADDLTADRKPVRVPQYLPGHPGHRGCKNRRPGPVSRTWAFLRMICETADRKPVRVPQYLLGTLCIEVAEIEDQGQFHELFSSGTIPGCLLVFPRKPKESGLNWSAPKSSLHVAGRIIVTPSISASNI